MKIVMKDEGTCLGRAWKQIAVISDGQIAWFDLEPALLAGWNVKRSWVDGTGAWGTMTASQILAWKQASGYPMAVATDAETAWALSKVAP